MNDDDYTLNRQVSDFFDEALGLGLADDIKKLGDNRYLPGKQIARGGMKSIEVAVDTVTGREVAKALLIGTDDPEKVERFFHEARICASLEHPNIVPVYDAGYDEDNQPFFTMRLLGGQTLQKLTNKKEAPLGTLLDIFAKVCDAVSYAHSQGIIHRDLKPDNIQIGDFGEVQVCDWGLACRDGFKNSKKNFDSPTKEYVLPVTLDGMIKGTPGYLSPEQASNEKVELTVTSDIYSLGAILYRILTDKSPLEGLDTLTSIRKTLSGDIKPIKEICPETPNSLIAICQKAMAVDPLNRYQNVEELKNDLIKYQHGFPTAAEEAGTWNSLKLFIKRNQKTAILIVSFLLIFNSTLIWYLINLSSKEQQARKAEVEAKSSAEQAKKAENQAREAEADANEAAMHAQQSELEAIEAMRQVKNALDELKEMTDQRDLVSKKASPRFLRLGKMERSAFQFRTALEFLEEALHLSPGDPDVLAEKGKIYMALLKFKEAHDIFKPLNNINRNLINICDSMSQKTAKNKEITLEDIYSLIRLYKKYNVGRLYLEELIYSPALNFLTTEERQKLAVKAFAIYHPVKERSFLDMKSQIEKRIPQLLYKTGIQTFDLRKAKKTRTHMIRGPHTQRVLIPEDFNMNIVFNDLKECPNLKEIYVPHNFNEFKYFNKLNIKILRYKDYQ